LDALWQEASRAARDCDFGLHAAEAVRADSFGILSYLGVTSPTWRDGLDRVCKYFRILSDASEYQLRRDGESVRVIAFHGVVSTAHVRHRVEFTVAVLHCYGRAFVDGGFTVSDVFFEHAKPARCDEHERIFGRAPRFGQPESGFTFLARLLDRPLRSHEPTLNGILARQAEHILADASTTLTVTDALRATLLRGGGFSASSVATAARKLGMSARTLQRRLREEGTTHARVVDELRRSMALQMLKRRDIAICEAAFALGFSEPAALHHAFKRWTGCTPAEFRRAARRKPADESAE
jgi:AraC-like DNA-binding protein